MFQNSKYVHEKYSWIKFKRNNENGKRKRKQKNRKKNSGKWKLLYGKEPKKGNHSKGCGWWPAHLCAAARSGT